MGEREKGAEGGGGKGEREEKTEGKRGKKKN